MENVVPLVVAAQHGDVEAFTRLIQDVSPFAFGLAWQRLQDRQTSQDVVQEALLETYVCLPRLHEPAAFLAWFRRIVIKRIDREQRRHHVITHPVESLEALAREEEDQARRASSLRVQAALESLPDSLRAVTELYYLGEGSYQSIAATLDLPLSTVKKRLFDARQRLRRLLQQEDMLPHQADFFTQLAFFLALHRRQLAQLQALLAQFPDLVEAREEWDEHISTLYALYHSPKYTPLHRAATLGDEQILQCLLQHGADPNARAGLEVTPLHVAVAHDAVPLILQLLQAGANPNAATSQGMTPLHWAVIRGNPQSTRLLCAAGASDQLPDVHGRTPWEWSVLKHTSAYLLQERNPPHDLSNRAPWPRRDPRHAAAGWPAPACSHHEPGGTARAIPDQESAGNRH